MSGGDRYSKGHIKRGLTHFLLGKTLSSIGGIVYLLLLVRELEVGEFASYSVLTAFVELFTALTGFGLTHVLLRYAPELHVQKLDKSLKKLIATTIGLRAVVLIVSLGIAYVFGNVIADFFELLRWLWAYELFLMVVFLRATRNMIFQSMESLLQQRLAQRALVVNTYLKLLAFVGLIVGGQVSLRLVIYVEILSELIGLVLLIYWQISWLKRISAGCVENGGWLSKNLSRMVGYGAVGYLQHLAIMLYGSSPNRLMISRYLSINDVATFGFAQSLIDVVRRYLPAQLFVGFMRPVLIARFTQSGDFSAMVKHANMVLKINLVLLALLAVSAAVFGGEFFSALTRGKYSDLAAFLFLGMIGVLALESQRYILDMLLQVVEKNGIQVLTNLILSVSILLALLLMQELGAGAVIVSNAIGLFVTNLIIILYLRGCGYLYDLMAMLLVKLFLAVILAAGFGWLLKEYLTLWLSGMLSIGLFILAVIVIGFVKNEEYVFVKAMVRKERVQ